MPRFLLHSRSCDCTRWRSLPCSAGRAAIFHPVPRTPSRRSSVTVRCAAVGLPFAGSDGVIRSAPADTTPCPDRRSVGATAGRASAPVSASDRCSYRLTHGTTSSRARRRPHGGRARRHADPLSHRNAGRRRRRRVGRQRCRPRCPARPPSAPSGDARAAPPRRRPTICRRHRGRGGHGAARRRHRWRLRARSTRPSWTRRWRRTASRRWAPRSCRREMAEVPRAQHPAAAKPASRSNSRSDGERLLGWRMVFPGGDTVNLSRTNVHARRSRTRDGRRQLRYTAQVARACDRASRTAFCPTAIA